MKTKAIERIRDYCTEVTQNQWDELVKVAQEAGLECVIGRESRKGMITLDKFVRYNTLAGVLGVYPDKHYHHEQIPFQDFLAKLKGWDGEGDPFTSAETLAMASKPWQPTAGEMVETSVHGDVWHEREFIGKRNGFYVCWSAPDSISTFPFPYCRLIRPTVTRAEAEAQLGKRIID